MSNFNNKKKIKQKKNVFVLKTQFININRITYDFSSNYYKILNTKPNIIWKTVGNSFIWELRTTKIDIITLTAKFANKFN